MYILTIKISIEISTEKRGNSKVTLFGVTN